MSDLDDSEPSLSGSAFLEAQRLRPSQNALRQLQDELTKGTASFKPPQTIVFSPAATYSNPTLAFDAKNKPLLAREDELVKLLTRLDAVESAGDDGIRKRRKEIVLEVEEELARLDQFKRDQFKALQSGSSQEHTIQETSQPEKRAGESIPRSNPGSPPLSPASQPRPVKQRKTVDSSTSGSQLNTESQLLTPLANGSVEAHLPSRDEPIFVSLPSRFG